MGSVAVAVCCCQLLKGGSRLLALRLWVCRGTLLLRVLCSGFGLLPLCCVSVAFGVDSVAVAACLAAAVAYVLRAAAPLRLALRLQCCLAAACASARAAASLLTELLHCCVCLPALSCGTFMLKDLHDASLLRALLGG